MAKIMSYPYLLNVLYLPCYYLQRINEPAHAIMVFITWATSGCFGTPVLLLAKASAARINVQSRSRRKLSTENKTSILSRLLRMDI